MVLLGSGISWVTQNYETLFPIVQVATTALVAYKVATVSAAVATTVTGLVAAAATGNWLSLGAAVLGAAAAFGIYSSMNRAAGGLGNGAIKSVEDAQKAAEKAIAKAPKMSLGSVPVEVSNKSPISVKGEVEIEKETLRYQFDLAAQKAFAMFNMTQIVPQVVVQNQHVSKTIDVEEVNNALGDMVYQNQQTKAAGVYG